MSQQLYDETQPVYDDNDMYDSDSLLVDDDEEEEMLHDEEVVSLEVKDYLSMFYQHFTAGHVHELTTDYDARFNKISDKNFKKESWPSAESIAPLVNHDAIFLTLYKDLYFRHIHVKLSPTVRDRLDAYQNYVDLFNVFLAQSDGKCSFDLPALWMCDIVDEFVFQYQSFCAFRDRVDALSDADKVELQQNPASWNSKDVLVILNALVEKSGIRAPKGDNEKEDEAPSTLRLIGYYACVGLLRVNFMLGDFQAALEALAPVNFRKRSAWMKVATCQVTIYYYMGFSYLMSRRFVDAVKIFCNILSFIARARQNSRSRFSETMDKQESRILYLLAIAVSFTNQRLEENLQSSVRDKCGDLYYKLQRNEETAFEQLFLLAKPVFVNANAPNFEVAADYSQEALLRQKQAFLEEVRDRLQMTYLISMLKLYSSITVSKLAKLMDLKESEAVARLESFKQKSKTLRWQSGSPASGVLESTTDMSFTMDGDVIHVQESKTPRRFGDYFLRSSQRLKELCDEVSRITV